MHIMEYCSVIKKEMKYCYNMDKPCKHYAKWKKTATKGQTLWFPCDEILRVGKFTEKESRLEVTRAGREKAKGGLLLRAYRVLFEMTEVLETDSGNDCTTLWIYLIPLKLTFENGQNNKFCYTSFI